MIRTLIHLWMDVKRRRSLKRLPQERVPLPKFKSIEELAEYLRVNFIYTGDALGGLDDRYTHPEHLNYWIVKNLKDGKFGPDREWPLRVDCDDVSAFACRAAWDIHNVLEAQMFVFGYASIRAAIKDLIWRFVTTGKLYLYFHEGCLITNHEGDVFLLDTNGLKKLGNDLEDGVDERDAAKYLSKVYGVKYETTVAVPYPFKE